MRFESLLLGVFDGPGGERLGNNSVNLVDLKEQILGSGSYQESGGREPLINLPHLGLDVQRSVP